jgi:hypothetical protein
VSAWLGTLVGRMSREPDERAEHDIGVVLAATLTLLGLIIGFSFSMAISRYDQRKNYEEAEANSIGTEFVRADLLPPDDAGRVRLLLKQYLDQRVLFYTTRKCRRHVAIARCMVGRWKLGVARHAGSVGGRQCGRMRRGIPTSYKAADRPAEERHGS